MCADRSQQPIVHFVGSIPLPDAETVFRTLSAATGPHLVRLPDGETGIRKTWITLPAGRAGREPGDRGGQRRAAVQVHPVGRQADPRNSAPAPEARRASPIRRPSRPAMPTWRSQSWRLFDRLQKAGVIPASVKFQISLPTPIAPTYNNMVPADRPGAAAGADAHLHRRGREDRQRHAATTASRCNGTCARRCSPGRAITSQGPVDFRTETIDVLIDDRRRACRRRSSSAITCATAARPTSTWCSRRTPGIMVEMTNAIVAGVRRPIQFFHMPVPKARTDDAYFAPLDGLKLRPETELYLGLIHHDDAAGDAARLAAARRHARVDGIATECGMARGDPDALPGAARRARARCDVGLHKPAITPQGQAQRAARTASSPGPTKRANSRQPSLAMSSMTANTAGTNTSDSSVEDIRPPITAIAIGARNSPPEPTP